MNVLGLLVVDVRPRHRLVASVPFDTKSHFFNNSVLTSLFSVVPGLKVFIGGENFRMLFFFVFDIFIRALLWKFV